MAKKEKEKPIAEAPVQDNNSEPVKEETSPDTAAGELTALKDENEKLKAENSELKDKFMRTAAEYENFRKRSQREKEALFSDVKSDIAAKFLPVIDNFERAALTESDFEQYKKGIEMTEKQLREVMKAIGAECFAQAGDEFDPNIHNAVMHVEDEALGENVITDVFVKGWKLGDKVIRPAAVKVAN